MYGLLLCNEYINRLDAFIDFAKKDMLDNVGGNLCCPCKQCKNEKKYHTYDVLMSHLIKHEFMKIIDVRINMGKSDLMKQR
jgi:hypothetical protein